jgi:hypothetical protein
MARVNREMLSKIGPLANAKIDGFPSNVLIGNDHKLATFKGSNAIPNIRDTKVMNTLLTADPSQLAKTMNNSPGESESAVPTESAENALTRSGEKYMRTRKNRAKRAIDPEPPNLNRDLTPSVGGSLYRSLLQLIRGTRKRKSKGKN